jgi:biotin transport system substrate-specific component
MALATPAPGVLADAIGARTAIRNLILVLGGAAFVGLAAQVSIPLPFTPVPVTGQTFAVLLTAGVLGAGRAVASMLLYIALGMAGVPWFAGGSTAFKEGALVVTFGYVVGFLVAAALVGYLAQRGNTRTPLRAAGLMVLGNIVIYLIGATWLAAAINVSLSTAFEVGVQPFLLGDALKILLAAGLFPLAWSAVDLFTKRS